MTTAKKVAVKKTVPNTIFHRISKLVAEIQKMNERGLGSLGVRVNPKGYELGNLWSDTVKAFKNKTYSTLEELEADLIAMHEVVKRTAPIQIENIDGSGQAAKVEKTGIRVGCRKVTFAKFDALVAGVARFRENQKELVKNTPKAKPRAKAKAKKPAPRRLSARW